jgi:hypothetical protein
MSDAELSERTTSIEIARAQLFEVDSGRKKRIDDTIDYFGAGLLGRDPREVSMVSVLEARGPHGIFAVLLLACLGVPIPEEMPIIASAVLSHEGPARRYGAPLGRPALGCAGPQITNRPRDVHPSTRSRVRPGSRAPLRASKEI